MSESDLNRLSINAVRKFDSLDLSECALENCGVSKRYTNDAFRRTLPSELQQEISEDKPIRILVANKGKQKPLVLKLKTIEEVLMLAGQKLNLRPKPTKVLTPQGNHVSAEDLKSLADGAVLHVS